MPLPKFSLQFAFSWTWSLVGADLGQLVYTYKRVVCVCLFVCWFVCFLSATRHLSTLRRCLRVLREQPSRRGRAARRERAIMHLREHARASRTCNFSTKNSLRWCLSKTNPYARAHAVVYVTAEIFKKKGKRKPTCHFPSSVYSLPSLGVFTFRIVLNRTWSLVGADLRQLVYTYKRAVCVCWFVCLLFIGHTTFAHFAALPPSTPRAAKPSRAAPRARRASMHSESTRAHAVQLLNEKIVALMHDAFQKQNRTRACCRIRNCRDFQEKGKRKPTCHFPSSVYSLPSLGVFTFRIVLNRILHKSSLLAPMESRRTRRRTFTAEERLERRREQDRRRHAERRAWERREQPQARRDVDRLRSSQARA